MHFCWSLKNLLVLIYSKLHSKSCDYLYISSKSESWSDSRKVSSDLKTSLKLTLRTFGFLWALWQNMSINLNYIAWGKGLMLTWSKKESVVCEAFFYLKYSKFTFLEIYLSLFRLCAKTTNAYALGNLKSPCRKHGFTLVDKVYCLKYKVSAIIFRSKIIYAYHERLLCKIKTWLLATS